MGSHSPRRTATAKKQVSIGPRPLLRTPTKYPLTDSLCPVYLGDGKFDPIWEELNKRKSVVFLHGTQTPSSNTYPHIFLGVPITEVS